MHQLNQNITIFKRVIALCGHRRAPCGTSPTAEHDDGAVDFQLILTGFPLLPTIACFTRMLLKALARL